MNFKRLPETSDKTNGTFLQDVILITYAELNHIFGISDAGFGKTQAEWALEFEDGTIATIYDWKEDIDKEDVTEWHIGGFNKRAVERITEVLGK